MAYFLIANAISFLLCDLPRFNADLSRGNL